MLVPVAKDQAKLGNVFGVNETVFVILNVPNRIPGGAGIAIAKDADAIALIIRICLLVALIFQLGACCMAGREGSAEPATNAPVMVPPLAIPA